MGPVPPDFTLEKFVARQLAQICIGPFDLQFRFDGGPVISCNNGKVMVEVDGKSTVVFEKAKWLDSSPLPLVVGRDVVSWRVEASHEFSVTLTGDGRLRFLSSDSPYEDFVISPGYQIV